MDWRKQLERLCRRRNLSPAALAVQIGLDREALLCPDWGALDAGKTVAAAAALGVRPTCLLGWEEPPCHVFFVAPDTSCDLSPADIDFLLRAARRRQEQR